MFATPIHKDLVLIGGGHSHIEVLRKFGMKPLPGVRLTLVTRDVHTPYSGMLPGYVSGFYSYDECHIDLERLARFANARLIHSEATSIDTTSEQIRFAERPPLPYDVLSINVGITPAASIIPGAKEFAVPVKPIDRFVAQFESILKKVRHSEEAYSVVVVGGGPGGVELACALKHRLIQERQNLNKTTTNDKSSTSTTTPPLPSINVTLVCRGQLLQSQAPYARTTFLKLLQERDIQLIEGSAVAQVESKQMILANGSILHFDSCVWCTQASAAPWFADSALPVDDQGFIAVNEYLQLDGGTSNVFAAGDCAGMKKHPRPKAGVYAVRAGPPLADNIRRLLENQPLVSYTPQSTNLALITAGDKYCVATKGSWFGIKGAFLWKWKDSIDRRFMAKYSTDLNFENMNTTMNNTNNDRGQAPLSYQSVEGLALLAASKMRCGGCGGKVGSSILSRVLKKLQQLASDDDGGDDGDVVLGLETPDDAAVLEPPPPGHVTVHTVDFFRAMVSDPYLFGSIAATHALSDCHAMGAQPTAALAIAVIPFAAPSKIESDLHQLMAGAVKVLGAERCKLVGGHTSEGAELALGFSIYGTVAKDKVLRKGGLQPGQVLILTKALGHGTVMAAAMKGVGKGRWSTASLDNMLLSNASAGDILAKHKATAATDVTGFGLLGHVVEMCRASNTTVSIDVASLPLIDGTLECVATGALSSLHEENSKVAAAVCGDGDNSVVENIVQHSMWPVLVDPQTGGGLVAGIPADQAEKCVEELRAAGYSDAAVIGRVKEKKKDVGGGCDDDGERWIEIELPVDVVSK